MLLTIFITMLFKTFSYKIDKSVFYSYSAVSCKLHFKWCFTFSVVVASESRRLICSGHV